MNNELPDDDTKTVKFLLKENLARYKLNNKGKKLKTIIIDESIQIQPYKTHKQ